MNKSNDLKAYSDGHLNLRVLITDLNVISPPF